MRPAGVAAGLGRAGPRVGAPARLRLHGDERAPRGQHRGDLRAARAPRRRGPPPRRARHPRQPRDGPPRRHEAAHAARRRRRRRGREEGRGGPGSEDQWGCREEGRRWVLAESEVLVGRKFAVGVTREMMDAYEETMRDAGYEPHG